MSGWRPALRIARRSVRRHRGRSILIAALIGVPLAGATVMNGLLETATGPENAAYQAMGTADGSMEVTWTSSLSGWEPGAGYVYPVADNGDRDPKSVDLARLLPAGSRFVPDLAIGSLRLTQDDRVVRTNINLVAVGDELTEHQARVASGRSPRGPDEAMITEPLAQRLHLLDGDELRAGATITPEGGPTVTLTGIATTPMSLNNETVVAAPNSALRTSPGMLDVEGEVYRYLVDLPPGANADEVWPALADEGVAFTPRAAYTDPGRYPQSYVFDDPLETLGPVAAVVGFGLLEVVLLAGAAFAVGARRQVRELGLVAANGGTAKHVRRTVLAQGLALGLVGAVGGLLFGVLVTVAGWSVWEWLFGQVIDGWRFDWAMLAVTGAVGLLSGLAAALLPAIGAARMEPVDALAQRFRVTSLRARLPLLGVVLVAVGVTGVLISAVLARREIAETAPVSDPAAYVAPDLAMPIIGVLGAGLLAIVGLIMITSGLVATLARLGGRLPLSGRLALRDAGRHRHRTVPAIAAIMIVVAGSVTLAFLFAASAAGELRSQPENTLMVRADPSLVSPAGDGPGDEAADRADEARQELAAGSRAAAAKLPGSSTVDIPVLYQESGSQVILDDCTASQVGVATPEVLEQALGRPADAGLRAALDDGAVVTLDECAARDGAASTAPGEGAEPVTLPARRAERPAGTTYWALPAAFVSAETAAEHGWRVAADTVLLTHPPSADQDDIDAALFAAQDYGLEAYEPDDDAELIDLVNLALAAGAGLVTVLGVGITIALSAAESRADLATLAAIGARPRRRRLLAGAQAFVLSGLGTVLGVGLGGVLGFAMVALAGESAFAVPWANLAVTVVAVPLLAVGVAMSVTRSRLPMVQRVE